MKKTVRFFLLIGVWLHGASAQAQIATEAAVEDHSYKPLTLKLSEDGKKYVRFIMWHQFWATANQNNPDTRDINGNLIDGTNGARAWTTDIALRRSRFLAYAQISPRALILTHWGINNQSFINGGLAPGNPSNGGKKPQLYIHDAWTEFETVKDKLYLGIGLHYWNGVSRLSSNSTLNFMTLDAPIFNWYAIEATDQFARQFGIYAKGQLGRLDYRVALNKPFANGGTTNGIASNNVAVNVLNENWAEAGYFNYMFWDKENNKLPFFVGSYLGTKKVFNIGAGFYRHSKASLRKSERDSTFHDHLVLGADVFVDMPLNKNKGTALNFLATYYNMNFGPNYLRNIGILNLYPTSATLPNSFAGGGNSQPLIGTGSIVYLQSGFLLPRLPNGQSFMPYATLTYKNFERLADASTQFGLGVNYFVTGHHAKISLEYQTRPVYKAESDGIRRNGSRGEFILQTHIFL
ncbi:MAG: porin [Saprospiraceae bacterium]